MVWNREAMGAAGGRGADPFGSPWDGGGKAKRGERAEQGAGQGKHQTPVTGQRLPMLPSSSAEQCSGERKGGVGKLVAGRAEVARRAGRPPQCAQATPPNAEGADPPTHAPWPLPAGW